MHTGGTLLSLGKGHPCSASRRRQKINTRSSTEAELVGINGLMPMILWTRLFMEAQGYDVSDNVVFQDSKSTMLLARNGKGSSGKRTKHIDIRYFFVKDLLDRGQISMQHCPTGDIAVRYKIMPVLLFLL